MKMERKVILVFGLSFFLAGLLYYSNFPIASSQSVTVVSKLVDKAPADDPNAAIWSQASPIDVPLSAQLITKPRVFEAHVRKVRVRSLMDGNTISFLLEWEAQKPSMDLIKHEDFRDAVAIQFPVNKDEPRPYFCMGQEDGAVNIWHWKADWEQDLAGFKDINDTYPNMAADNMKSMIGEQNAPYPSGPYQNELQPDSEIYLTGKGAGNMFSDAGLRKSPIENLVAGGFGTLTTSNIQNVQGKGIYSDGKWKVVFSRDINTEDEEVARFTPNKFQPIAFAVWNGAEGDRDGMKSVSSWYWMVPEGKTNAITFLLPIGAMALVGAGEYFLLKRRKRREK
ncbi:MAG: ethylbenzene dehydrogenase-related protein [Candidatus Hydrothermarchaeaceae archaeon]